MDLELLNDDNMYVSARPFRHFNMLNDLSPPPVVTGKVAIKHIMLGE